MNPTTAILLTLGLALAVAPPGRAQPDDLPHPALEPPPRPHTALQAVFHSNPRAVAQSCPDADAPAHPPDPQAEDAWTTFRRIVGTDPAPIGLRLKAVHGLGESLTPNQLAALTVFLKLPPPPNEPNREGLRVLKNDLLNVLRHQASPPPGLTDLLIAIHRDPTQDPVLRDYALQHLVVWYEQGAPDTPKAREQIRAVLEAAARGHDSLAGTALLGLHRLSAREPAFEAAKIDRLALHLVRSGATDPATRITAVAVCAERGLTEALPNIAALMDDPACVPLRLAAHAAWSRLSALAGTHLDTPAAGDEAASNAGLQKLAHQSFSLKRQPD